MPPSGDSGPHHDTPRAEESLADPRLREAATLMETGQLRKAEAVLQEFVRAHPRDLSALRLLAEIATRQSRFQQAEEAFAKCVELAPTNSDFRYSYVNVLLEGNKHKAALAEIEKTLAQEPGNPVFRGLKAIALEAIEDYESAAALWRELVKEAPND